MFHCLAHWHCHKFFRIHRPHFWACHIAPCWLPPHLDRAVRALSSAKSGLWYVRHRLTVSDCKPLGPDELRIRRCVSSQLGCVYTMWTYLALSGTCIIHFFKPQICQPPHLWCILLFWHYVNKTFCWLISFFFFFFNFSISCTGRGKLSHSPEYSDKSLSQGLMFSRESKVYFCQFGAMFSLKSVADYSLCGDNALFPSVMQLWKLKAKPGHFFS